MIILTDLRNPVVNCAVQMKSSFFGSVAFFSTCYHMKHIFYCSLFNIDLVIRTIYVTSILMNTNPSVLSANVP